ncbi:MAG TPA: hypothetical protein VNJ08_04670 [Bacteriovoracaceae bacterium]|nr:hypothetical protein [Bacteriovoracaceae bacterium]
MNKLILLTVLFMSFGCGNDHAKVTNLLGETRAFSPVVMSDAERTRLTTICNALTTKAQALAQVNTQNLSFSVSQRECSAAAGFLAGSVVIVPTTITANPPEFKLRRADNGNPFVYADLETSESGIMKTVCAELATATNPRRLDNGTSIWITTSDISTTDCNPKGNELCLQIETGTPNGTNFDITTREWMKFQLDASLPRYGFFTERRTLTNALCGLNLTSQTQAILNQ